MEISAQQKSRRVRHACRHMLLWGFLRTLTFPVPAVGTGSSPSELEIQKFSHEIRRSRSRVATTLSRLAIDSAVKALYLGLQNFGTGLSRGIRTRDKLIQGDIRGLA